ncbi:MAG: SAM-dependent methyltransferase [Alphaproteobacteria bacterium]
MARKVARRNERARGAATGRRTPSSGRWLARQRKDPYARAARARGYRSRAAFKLAEIDDSYRLLAPGRRVVDLGAAPGGWAQVAVERVRPQATGGVVLAVDRDQMDPVPGAAFLRLDVLAPGAAERIGAALGAKADAVLSDMASAATGHGFTDQARSLELAQGALEIAAALLAPGGALLVKLLRGPGEEAIVAAMRRAFATVKRVKPPASRAHSKELYLVGLGRRQGPP